MSEKIQIKSFVTDLITQVIETVGPIERQIEDETVKRFPTACNFLIESRRVLNDQTTALRTHLDEIGGEPSTGFKAAVNGVFTAALSMVQTSHKDHVSEYLKEDHAALAALLLSYEVLHISALATHSYSTAALSLRHTEEIAALAMQCSRVVPSVVVSELVERDDSLDGSVVSEAQINIHRAFRTGVRLETINDHRQFAATV
jgi:hypothetical protein